MKDPIVAEVRRLRMEHTKRFGGDLARICEDLRKLEAKVDAAELERRRKAFSPPAPRYTRGYLAKYARMATSAATGAILKF